MRLSTLLAAIGMAALLGALPACAQDKNDVQGIWRHPDNGSLIQIYSCDDAICAKIVSVTDQTRTDIKNPDPALRKRPIVGIVIWRHAKETANLQWSGSSYNPLDGAIYYGTLHLTSPTTLVVAGCNLSVTPCFERTWKKVAPETAKAVLTTVSRSRKERPAAKAVAEKPKAPAKAKAKPKAKAVAIKHKRPVKPQAQKPKVSAATVAEPPKPLAGTRAERPRDPDGYNDLPHIHIAR
jgi:uncharacterized protein (DUF2147 family)